MVPLLIKVEMKKKRLIKELLCKSHKTGFDTHASLWTMLVYAWLSLQKNYLYIIIHIKFPFDCYHWQKSLSNIEVEKKHQKQEFFHSCHHSFANK